MSEFCVAHKSEQGCALSFVHLFILPIMNFLISGYLFEKKTQASASQQSFCWCRCDKSYHWSTVWLCNHIKDKDMWINLLLQVWNNVDAGCEFEDKICLFFKTQNFGQSCKIV